MAEIQNLTEAWQGHSGAEVEAFIKKQFNENVGYFRWSSQIDASNNYHLEGFASKDDADLYDRDPETYASLRLIDAPLPISTVQGDSYASYLFRDGDAMGDIVLKERDLSVNLKFCAVKNSEGQRLNMDANGTLYIQRSTDGGTTWTTVGTKTGVISQDYTAEAYATTLQLGQYLAEASQRIRIRASFTYQDEYEQDHVIYSTWINVASSITLTNLSLRCNLNWQNALLASDLSGAFPINYQVYGAVSKTLHIVIQSDAVVGGQQVSAKTAEFTGVTADGTAFSTTITDSGNTCKLFVHGVRRVEAWLTASDGRGGTLESEHLVNNFMVIDYATAGSNANKPYIMLQGIKETITNYVQSTICQYAVFNPIVDGTTITGGTDPVDITFRMTNFGNTAIYFESNSLVTPNVQHNLTTTVEVESESVVIETFLRITRLSGSSEVAMISPINIHVDNTENFSPTNGATFVLNPKVRNNTEADPQRILNAASNNAVVASTWTGFDMISDGWVADDDGIKVLRVLAGQQLTIAMNPFAQFVTNPSSSMTMEFDMAVRNVTNEDDPILRILETVGSGDSARPLGLSIKPMEGNLFTKQYTVGDETNFRFCEDKRTHIAINIHNAVQPNVNGDGLYDPNAYTPAQSIALARIFINGNIEREIEFNTASYDEFCTGAMSNGGIVIGQNDADIDIYGIRIYAGAGAAALSANDIVRDYISTLPTAAEKLSVRAENNIMTGDRVDVEKVKALGKRVLILHGLEPYQFLDNSNLWWEIFQYNADGSLNPDLSGTICKATGMPAKRQGTTANTYYYSNIQTKIDDGGTIQIPLSQFHSSIQVSQPYTDDGQTFVDILGGNLGKNEPVMASAQAKPYPYANGMVSVPDGWIDGNGKYRGMGYMVAEGTPLATKLVLKTNYASSMQSHLCAGTRLYNDLHTAVVGKNSLQTAVPTARVAKYTEPVYFFTQANDSAPVIYRGGGNFGAGKMDKPTWGYVKGLHPMFTMIEGADNNAALTDMRVPFITDERCSEATVYDAGDEGFKYNGIQCLDFDAGKTDDDDVPVSAIIDRLAETWNFLYLHSPMLRYYEGTFNAFKASSEADNVTYKYWFTEGPDAYRLKRYNHVDKEWVDAGMWTYGSGYAAIDLRTDSMTAAAYNSTDHSNLDALNAAFIGAIANHAKERMGLYFNVRSLQFHYVFQNHFMAGTDNCSKNTYFVLDPVEKDVTFNGSTQSCYLWELHQDDVDTILVTDNNGRSTKPYYIDRMHPYPEGSDVSSYEGQQNVLFNLIEEMYEGTRELQAMMKSTFTAMTNLVTAADMEKGITKSVWGCLEKYFFSIQHFYSQTAYNEQARIRYEWPALLGFISTGKGARGVRPITQSMGSQLEAETQYMLRRVIYMASYAGWGEFGIKDQDGSTGIADANSTMSFMVYSRPNASSDNRSYYIDVTPHQYLYPTGLFGTTRQDAHVRVAPGQQYSLFMGSTTSNDTGMSVQGANYYRSFGNMGDVSVSPELSFAVTGKRLVEFIASPTTVYNVSGKQTGAFRPKNIEFNAKLLRSITLGSKTGNTLKNSGIGGSLNVSNLTRLTSLDIRGSYMTDVTLPASMILTSVLLPASITALRLANLPNLSAFSLEGVSNMNIFEIGQNVGYNVYTILSQCAAGNAPLQRLVVSDVNWTNVGVAVLNFMSRIADCQVTGTITIYEPSSGSVVNFATKLALVQKFGNIDSPSNPLHIVYNVIQTTSIRFAGDWYLHWTGNHQYTASPSNEACNDVTSVEWSITDNAYGITIDQNGLLYAPQIAPSAEFLTITYRYNRLNAEPLVVTRNVGIYNRPAAVGDFVYYDGTYLDFWDDSKTVVGMCFYVNPDVPTDRRMVSMRRLEVNDNGSDNDCVGIGTDYFPDLVLTNGEDPYLTGIPATNAGVTAINATNILDGTQPDGYKRYDENTFFGDIAPMVVISDFEDVHAGDLVSRGKYYTHLFIEHRNMVLSNVTPALPIPVGTSVKSEYAHLEELIAAVKAANNNNNNYRQFYYPAASRCYAYEPTVRYNEALSQKFKAHKWWLPSIGELVRIQWLLNTNRTGNFAEAYTAGRLDNNDTSGGYNGIWSSSRGTSTNHEAQTRGNGVYYSGNDARVGASNSRMRPVTCF